MSQPAADSERRSTWLICIALAVVTLLAYGRMVWNRHDFILYDDHAYVTMNREVQEGLTWGNLVRVFRFDSVVAANWHPVTMLSHMLDCDLYGLRGWGHHLTSLLWHTVDTILLFLALRRMTGQMAASAMVAALFSWHPLHVESVAWVSERKDVLSAFFWFLTMYLYVGWVRQPSWRAYLGICVCVFLGVMSKPMLVTLPFALLLLDFWPLKRLGDLDLRSASTWRHLRQLIVEKWPLFAIVAVDMVLTFIAQRGAGAVAPLDVIPLRIRLVNMFMSYNAYIASMLWPVDLIIPYHIENRAFTFAQALLGGIGMFLVTLIVFLLRRRTPYLLTGWLWYLGTLLPVIGLVQVGVQYMADRYSYIPLIGLFIGIVFGLADLARFRPRLRPFFATSAAAVLAVLFVLTYRQVGYWQDTLTLFGHTATVDKRNYSAYLSMGTAYFQQGNYDEALRNFEQTLRINRLSRIARHDRGKTLRAVGRYDEAIIDLEKAEKLDAENRARIGKPAPESSIEIGEAYWEMNRLSEARQRFEIAHERAPQNLVALSGLARVAIRQGDINAAESYLKEAIQIMPVPIFHVMLARIYGASNEPAHRHPEEAVKLAEQACKSLHYANATALDTLAIAYAGVGRYADARTVAAQARNYAQSLDQRDFVVLIDEQLRLFQAEKPFYEDIRQFNVQKFDKPTSRPTL